MKKYIPYVWHINLDDGISVEKIEVPHEPYEDVFDTESIEYEKQHGITLDTDRLKHLVESGVEHNNLDTVVWTLYKQLGKDGVAINKAMTKEVLENA